MDILDLLNDAYAFNGDPLFKKAHSAIYDLREALRYIADMPDGWEEDEELNLLFVVDNHVKVAREALEETA